MKVITDLLNEIDDIIISSIFLSIIFSMSISGFSYINFSRYLIFFLVFLIIKIIYLKEISLALYYDHIEFFSIKLPEKEKVEHVPRAFFLSILRFIQAAPTLFFSLISIFTLGMIKIPVYGKIDIRVSFSDVKGSSRQATEKVHISLISYTFDLIFFLFLVSVGSDLSYIPFLTSLSLLLPYITIEGTNIFVFRKRLWMILVILASISIIAYQIDPTYSVYPILSALTLSLLTVWFERKSL